MTDLNRLKVSLTKHGAHKVAELIKNIPVNEVLSTVWGSYKDIKIDKAQAQKNLSAGTDDVLPSIWHEVKKLGNEAIDDLIFLAIIFSHHLLIKAMIVSSYDKFIGIVKRGEVLSGKEYTNFAHIIDELGFSVKHTQELVQYDLSRIFSKVNMVPLIVELFSLKLSKAGWDKKSRNIIDECLRLNFHKVFGLSQAEFKAWLESGSSQYFDGAEKDEFGDEGGNENIRGEFAFSFGHIEKSEGQLVFERAKSELKATLLHNIIQNKLFEHLSRKYGKNNIGTEVTSGMNTSIDLVRKDGEKFIFYEIKTSKSVRVCIRQALSQLLEYSYWPDKDLAEKLIIVTPNKLTENGKTYLLNLREKFGIPIFYQQCDLENNIFSEIF